MRQTTVLTQNSESKVYSDDNDVTEGSQHASVVSVSCSSCVRLAMDKHDDRERGVAVAFCQQRTQNVLIISFCLYRHH